MTSQVSLAFIGFGEAGLAIAETLSASGLATGMRAHDIKLTDHDPEIAAAMRERIAVSDVPVAFRGAAIGMITAGLMSLAFLGFTGLVTV